MLGVPEIKQYKKYFVLPSFVGRNKKASLMYIKERIWSKLRGWKEKLLSQASKEVLLKAVIQAILAYSMSSFKLPINIFHEIETLIRKFWWGQQGERRKVHWVKWSRLCRSKHVGGLGFRELQKFNDALLAKQVWRLMSNQDSLFFKIFKSKFFPHENVLDSKENRGSFAWKSILKDRDIIWRGMRWRIGDGSFVHIYHDSWLSSDRFGKVLSPIMDISPDATVSILIDHEFCCWRTLDIDKLFIPSKATVIKAIPLSFSRRSDTVFWPRNRNGLYSVKSGNKLLLEEEDLEKTSVSQLNAMKVVWNGIWKLRVPNHIRTLIYRAGVDALPTKANLVKKRLSTNAICHHYNLKPEDTLHAPWSYPLLSEVWQGHFSCL